MSMKTVDFMASIEDMNATTVKDISEIFSTVGAKHGYDTDVVVTPEAELKLNWIRTTANIRINVSDYIEGAPVAVVYDVACCLFDRLKGIRTVWLPVTTLYFSSEEFADRFQKTYIKRHMMLKGLATKGNGFVKEASKDHDVPKSIAFLYTSSPKMQVSASMRVVALPRSMRDASKEALWYAFDVGVRRIAEGVQGCRGEQGHPWIVTNITDEDRNILMLAGAWQE